MLACLWLVVNGTEGAKEIIAYRMSVPWDQVYRHGNRIQCRTRNSVDSVSGVLAEAI